MVKIVASYIHPHIIIAIANISTMATEG